MFSWARMILWSLTKSIANIFNKHFVNITSDIKDPESKSGANFEEDHPSISAILANLPEVHFYLTFL